jgi:hypothetical protein
MQPAANGFTRPHIHRTTRQYDEDGLKRILCVLVMAQDSIAHVVNQRAMAQDQFLKRGLLTFEVQAQEVRIGHVRDTPDKLRQLCQSSVHFVDTSRFISRYCPKKHARVQQIPTFPLKRRVQISIILMNPANMERLQARRDNLGLEIPGRPSWKAAISAT